MVKTKYNIDLLNCCKHRDKFILRNEYTILNRDTIIAYVCKCGKEGSKLFRYILDHGGFCEECIKEKQLLKRKATNLKRFGTENVMSLKEFRDKAIETNLKRFGVEYPIQNKNIFDKSKKTSLKKYGCEYPCQNHVVRNKIRSTLKKRYKSINN